MVSEQVKLRGLGFKAFLSLPIPSPFLPWHILQARGFAVLSYSDIADAEFQYSTFSVFCKPFILRDGKDSKVRFQIIILTFFCLILSSMFVWVTNSLAVQSQEHIVEISALRFSPTSLEVKSGDVVKWVNKDNRRHQLMSISEGGWRSRILRRGDSFVLFVGKTTFYICALHSNMRGAIKVRSD